MTAPDDHDVNVGQPEEDDHDLLTVTQASERLAVAIGEEQQRLDQAQQAGDEAAARASRDRIAALESAAQRHGQVAITAVNTDAFYGADGS